jgi:hypothetical protein
VRAILKACFDYAMGFILGHAVAAMFIGEGGLDTINEMSYTSMPPI